MDEHPDFTVIECAWQRGFMTHPQYDYFIKIAGKWITVGMEDFGDNNYEDVVTGYLSVTAVAGPT